MASRHLDTTRSSLVTAGQSPSRHLDRSDLAADIGRGRAAGSSYSPGRRRSVGCTMDGTIERPGWLDHLTDGDGQLLRQVAPAAGAEPAALGEGEALARVLAHPATFDAVFGSARSHAPPSASPFLVFAVAVHRGWAELRGTHHVDEWVGPRQRLPVLGGDDLREFLGSDARRFFLVELLASYTRVASGSTWVQTRRGWRRRRFSELDPVRLASLLEVVPAAERPGVYRRLGDLALFLTGVFPDHTELAGLGPGAQGRLLRIAGMSDGGPGPADVPTDAVALLEQLGERWYRVAVQTVPAPLTGSVQVVADVAERFGLARRSLNYLTDRYLFTRRGGFFGGTPA